MFFQEQYWNDKKLGYICMFITLLKRINLSIFAYMKRCNVFALCVSSMIMAFGVAVLSGCDDKKPEKENSFNSGGNGGQQNDDDNGDDIVYSAVKQKEIIEDAAIDLLNLFPTQNFEAQFNLGKDIQKIYDTYRWDNVEEWAKDAFEKSRTFLDEDGGKIGDQVYNYNYLSISYRYIDFEYTRNYNLLLALSNFTGHFIANNRGWDYYPNEELQFDFKDRDGNDCMIRLSTEGKTTTLKSPAYNHHEYDSHREETDDVISYYYYTYYDKYNLQAVVPEIIRLSLVRGGMPVVELYLKTDIRSLTDDSYLDLSTSIIGINSELKLDNGYRFVADNVLYEGNKNVLVQAHAYKDEDELLSVEVSAAMKGFPQLVISDEGEDAFKKYFQEDIKTDRSDVSDLNIKIDIHKKIQIAGSVTSLRKLLEYNDKANEFELEENKFKQYVSSINETIDMGLYFNGYDTKQADVIVEAFPKSRWYAGLERVEWDMRPVIVLSDGSQTSTFDDYFDEREFSKLIRVYESLLDDYEEMAD